MCVLNPQLTSGVLDGAGAKCVPARRQERLLLGPHRPSQDAISMGESAKAGDNVPVPFHVLYVAG